MEGLDSRTIDVTAPRQSHSLVSALRAVPSLAPLGEETLLAILGDSANLFWPAGAEVFGRGAAADGLYIVVSGSVQVLGVDGSELAVLGPGDFFGELSLLAGTPHRRDVVALEDAELMIVPKEAFDGLLAENAELAESIRRLADERIQANLDAAR
jgi:CRP/FNR family transcriptional regulator, cyclic AMP receptor protein